MAERKEPVWPKFVAGGVACTIMSFFLNPMDVIKVRLQLQNQLQHVSVTNPHGQAMYRGFSHAAFRIIKEEGLFGGLYKGITPALLREISYSSLRMGLYEPVKEFLSPHAKSKDDFTLTQKILAGAISGAMGSAFVNPTDLVKIRFQRVLPGEAKPYTNTFVAFYRIWKEEGGVKGLYRGVGPTVARAAVLTSAQLSSYDHSKRVILRSGYMDDTPALHLTSALISGLVTTTATNPVDIVKTRWMTDRSLYKSPIDVFVKIVAKEGPHALLKGWLPNYLRLGPHFIFSLPLMEVFRKMLGAGSVIRLLPTPLQNGWNRKTIVPDSQHLSANLKEPSKNYCVTIV